MFATRSRPHHPHRRRMSLNQARRRVPSLDVNNLFQQHTRMAGVLRAQAVGKYVPYIEIGIAVTKSGRVKLGSTAMTVRFRVCGRSENSKTMRDGNVLLSVTCHLPAQKRHSSSTKADR